MKLDPNLPRNITALCALEAHLAGCVTRPCSPFPMPDVRVLDPAGNLQLYRTAERLADLCGSELGEFPGTET